MFISFFHRSNRPLFWQAAEHLNPFFGSAHQIKKITELRQVLFHFCRMLLQICGNLRRFYPAKVFP
jgi:hypothetical protein